MSRSAAASEAVAHIQQLVQRGELSAGERLPPERELARELGLSRSTLREAIRALVVMNILVSRHGDGTYVSSLEPELLSAPFTFALDAQPTLHGNLFEARRVLETACARLAAERIRDDEIEELERLAAAAGLDPEEMIDRDLELHTAIARATRNPILLALMGSIGTLGLESRRDTAVLPGQAARTRRHHRAIIEALRQHSPDDAAEAMEAHLMSVERAVKRSRK
jgi:GntR family transcriptional repressor for pyruvate dehydrogenase complex